ncbi:hypothetical protein [Maribacter antarcticus]|nr:hypothetical protein [Maribacter antarcticus]
MEKSAAVIGGTGNVLERYPRGLISKKGPNVLRFKIHIGALGLAYAYISS